MKHLGDIKDINGADIPPVDCITGGFPCQDLSIAGKRAGLAGERSGLFMEQIRVIKEMRKEDKRRGRTGHMVRPRFMVWENVPGAFSSNRGNDFAAVIEETVKIVEPEAPSVSVPETGWPKCGCFYDDLGRWSVAWRVHDAQFWGVPQRRKRIALVADFGGLAAPEILFERKGLSWHPDESGEAREEAAAGTGKGAHRTVCLNDQGGSMMSVSHEVAGTLRAQEHGHQPVVAVHQNASGECRVSNNAYTIGTSSNASGRNTPLCFDARGNGSGNVCCTITGDHQNRVTDYTALCVDSGQLAATVHPPSIVIQDAISFQERAGKPGGGKGILIQQERTGALSTLNNQCVLAHGQANAETYPVQSGTVRRLTPLECERLQGFPDGWTDIGPWTDSKGKLHKESSDTARYKALGNSIALPFWFYLLRRISAQYERPATLGSLFDGIGGFPLCWERCNGKGTALWASEIEEFPMAVTKVRFPEGGAHEHLR